VTTNQVGNTGIPDGAVGWFDLKPKLVFIIALGRNYNRVMGTTGLTHGNK
jgi:hypothetical protein